MMDHIINFDWNYREPEEFFIKPEDLDNSVTERILRNKFRDPLISSEDEEDTNRPNKNIDWDKIFAYSHKNDRRHRVYVPGLIQPAVQYLKLSALTAQQHQQCLKVICAKYPHILPMSVMLRPTKVDLQIFEEVKEIYEKEQKEFKEWAKVLWTNDHCRRALRPKPRVESVYEACFKMKAAELQSFPKLLHVAAQIPLETLNKDGFEIVQQDDLITVNINELPEVECPLKITEQLSIMKPCTMPEPCQEHPCKFVLPTETRVTTKPLREVHKCLAQFACDHKATSVVAESALRCLLERERSWTFPVSVVDMFGSDGEPCNIIVLGSEFAALKEAAPIRTYRAFRHMLNIALVPDSEMNKLKYSNIQTLRVSKDGNRPSRAPFEDDLNISDDSSDEDDNMIIDADIDMQESSPRRRKIIQLPPKTKNTINDPDKLQEGCTCKGTLFEYPPPRSYKKWRVRNKNTNINFDVIVHCTHKLKVKGSNNELLLEPIPEYQLDLAASEQSEEKLQSLALALMLRKKATLANVRVDGSTGELVTFECHPPDQDRNQHHWRNIANLLHCTLDQLEGLLPGNYVLKHEPSYGANALLYAVGTSASAGVGSEPLSLQLDHGRAMQPDEMRSIRTPPRLAPVLLPMHKHRRILPLAFTYNQQQVAPEPRKPVTRQRTPPQALQWPKKKGKKRKRQY